jgi:hypothetical protein
MHLEVLGNEDCADGWFFERWSDPREIWRLHADYRTPSVLAPCV